MHDEPLNMCFSKREHACAVTALDIVNTFEESALVTILKEYGEERWAVRIARFIVNARKEKPIITSKHLANIVSGAVPRKLHPKHRHAATKTFQALRIAVNDELNILQEFLESLKTLIRTDTRLAIISFHSLEDRIVKQMFKQWESESIGKRYSKKAIQPSHEECIRNPRATSAQLRTFIFNV